MFLIFGSYIRVFTVFTICSPCTHCMFTVYSLYTHYRLTMCSLYGHCMSNRIKNLIQYSGKRFLFGWRIAENFILKVLNYLAFICGFYCIQNLFTMYSLYIYWMYIVYSLCTHYRLTTYSPYVHCMSNRVKNLIQYSDWRRFSFRWCITENFILKILNYYVLIYEFLLCSLSVHYVLTVHLLDVHCVFTIYSI